MLVAAGKQFVVVYSILTDFYMKHKLSKCAIGSSQMNSLLGNMKNKTFLSLKKWLSADAWPPICLIV